ncbi:MAG: winged helix DNA-binding domain-containing protein [Myxococcota bacterium]
MTMPPRAPMRASREQVLAFRLDGHHLARRLPRGSLLQTAGACGLQDTPPGSALLGMHARVSGLTPDDVTRALENAKTLFATWSLRGAPHVMPTRDASVFTLGLLPDDEESLRAFLGGGVIPLDVVGMTAAELVARTGEVSRQVLDGRDVTKDELGVELSERIARELKGKQRARWRAPSIVVRGQTMGESLVRFAISVVALQGVVCVGPRRGGAVRYARTDQWLGKALPKARRETAEAELVRRYLACYGPSTSEELAQWAGIGLAQAEHAWKRVAKELIPADIDGRTAWVHRGDQARLGSPNVPQGVRFLLPHDPFLQLRDRTTLAPERALQRRIWRAIGNPGVVLAEGRLMGLWRPAKSGKRLRISVELVAPMTREVRTHLEVEAAALAPWRGVSTVEVKVTSE